MVDCRLSHMYKVMGDFVLWAHGMIGTLTYKIGVTKGYAYYLFVITKQANGFEQWTFQD